jgi:transposase
VGQKLAMVREGFKSGKPVLTAMCRHGVNRGQQFHWCKLYQDGSVSALKTGEEAASKRADALKQVREL